MLGTESAKSVNQQRLITRSISKSPPLIQRKKLKSGPKSHPKSGGDVHEVLSRVSPWRAMSQWWGRCYICTSSWSSCSPKSVFFFFPSFPLFSALDLGAAVGGGEGRFSPIRERQRMWGRGRMPHSEEAAWGGHIRLGFLSLFFESSHPSKFWSIITLWS